MPIYSVSYDLRKPGRDYTLLHKKIKDLGAWWHYLDSTWLVKTSKSAEQIAESLRAAIDQNDRLLVINVGRDYAGWLENEAWEWLRDHSQAA